MTTLAVAGNGAIVPLVEGHAATRERWTVDVTVDDLESLFFYTLANIVVVSYDVCLEESERSAVADGKPDTRQRGKGAYEPKRSVY